MKGFPTNRRASCASLFLELNSITISAVSCRCSIPSAMAMKGVAPTPAHTHSIRDTVKSPCESKQVNCPPVPLRLIFKVFFVRFCALLLRDFESVICRRSNADTTPCRVDFTAHSIVFEGANIPSLNGGAAEMVNVRTKSSLISCGCRSFMWAYSRRNEPEKSSITYCPGRYDTGASNVSLYVPISPDSLFASAKTAPIESSSPAVPVARELLV